MHLSFVRTAVLGVLFVAFTAGAAVAQAPATGARSINFAIAAGPTFPVGDAADGLDTGWHLMASLGIQPAAQAFGLRFDGMWHNHSITAGGDLRVLAGAANVVMTVSNYNGVRPYVIGGIGMYNLDGGGTSETEFGLNGGGGVSFQWGGFTPFVELRLHSVFTEGSNTNLLPISFGIVF